MGPMLEAHKGTIRFVGGHYNAPGLFDWGCRLMARLPDQLTLETLTDPVRTIRLQSRYIGKVIGRVDSPTTTTICTYALDDDDAGMARWAEDAEGNVIVTAFDYPG